MLSYAFWHFTGMLGVQNEVLKRSHLSSPDNYSGIPVLRLRDGESESDLHQSGLFPRSWHAALRSTPDIRHWDLYFSRLQVVSTDPESRRTALRSPLCLL